MIVLITALGLFEIAVLFAVIGGLGVLAVRKIYRLVRGPDRD